MPAQLFEVTLRHYWLAKDERANITLSVLLVETPNIQPRWTVWYRLDGPAGIEPKPTMGHYRGAFQSDEAVTVEDSLHDAKLCIKRLEAAIIEATPGLKLEWSEPELKTPEARALIADMVANMNRLNQTTTSVMQPAPLESPNSQLN